MEPGTAGFGGGAMETCLDRRKKEADAAWAWARAKKDCSGCAGLGDVRPPIALECAAESASKCRGGKASRWLARAVRMYVRACVCACAAGEAGESDSEDDAIHERWEQQSHQENINRGHGPWTPPRTGHPDWTDRHVIAVH